MVKRGKNFDPKNGDWQYLVLDGSGSKVQPHDKGNCQSCHEPQKANGYIFRTYLPEEVERALR